MASISFGKLSAQKIRTDPLTTFITADSLVSGNFKDVLTSFYQLAFNNLTGPKKELNFNSNPYALLLKINSRLVRQAGSIDVFKFPAFYKNTLSELLLNVKLSLKYDGFFVCYY